MTMKRLWAAKPVLKYALFISHTHCGKPGRQGLQHAHKALLLCLSIPPVTITSSDGIANRSRPLWDSSCVGARFKGREEKDVRASAAPAGGEKTSVRSGREKRLQESVCRVMTRTSGRRARSRAHSLRPLQRPSEEQARHDGAELPAALRRTHERGKWNGVNKASRDRCVWEQRSWAGRAKKVKDCAHTHTHTLHIMCMHVYCVLKTINVCVFVISVSACGSFFADSHFQLWLMLQPHQNYSHHTHTHRISSPVENVPLSLYSQPHEEGRAQEYTHTPTHTPTSSSSSAALKHKYLRIETGLNICQPIHPMKQICSPKPSSKMTPYYTYRIFNLCLLNLFSPCYLSWNLTFPHLASCKLFPFITELEPSYSVYWWQSYSIFNWKKQNKKRERCTRDTDAHRLLV